MSNVEGGAAVESDFGLSDRCSARSQLRLVDNNGGAMAIACSSFELVESLRYEDEGEFGAEAEDKLEQSDQTEPDLVRGSIGDPVEPKIDDEEFDDNDPDWFEEDSDEMLARVVFVVLEPIASVSDD
ncbi:hypothetical protein OIV83_005381 [Microbotryomycetes sp. JL201]|nr:hypothetical protein OIV83_005381 [Microbotryomycetes sp. JL201]